MSIMIALPDDKFFAVPREVLEQYAVPETEFIETIKKQEAAGETVFDSDVEGQSCWTDSDGNTRCSSSAAMGIRG